MRTVLLIALGGAAGSVARHGVGLALRHATGLPWGTLAVNVAGSLALGLLVALVPAAGAPWRALLGVGFCGGFTTFSTFGVEALALVQRGQPARAAGYVAASVGLGLAAAAAGLALGRTLAPAR